MLSEDAFRLMAWPADICQAPRRVAAGTEAGRAGNETDDDETQTAVDMTDS